MLKVKDLRDSFIAFFREREHRIVPSSSLIPKDDPTMLFTTAGMVQFKPMFAGTVDLEYTRAATIQKCLRTSDLENVGKTKRHCTYFEMLGNFSFGDYFKKEAIEYAWDYSVDIVGFNKDDIWISIYKDDDEAFTIWNEHIGVPVHKIVRLGKEDNFWGPAGDSGACGPCTELYIDRGAAFGCDSPDCKPGCDCERFLEYWNLVFNQFFQDVDGKQTPLPKTGIDTGMGLERLAAIVQDVDSIYGIDEMKRLVDFICRERNLTYDGDTVVPVNVMVEHARALTFAIADGAYPSNEGRGYVLRRILRRALRFSRQIGISDPFIYRMVDPLVDIMGEYYPEIVKASENVKNILEGEEKRFLETLENGMDRLDEIIKDLRRADKKSISGRDAFVLYDTYGFPLEMTVEIASERELGVDIDGFEEEMSVQRERGRKSWKGVDSAMEGLFEIISRDAGETEFRGYEHDVTASDILLLGNYTNLVDRLKAGDAGLMVTRETTFYGESGGQVGDSGEILSSDGAVFRVDDTVKINKTIVHIGRVSDGEFSTGDRVRTEIDVIRRNLTRANHTSTHLLNAALRNVLGDHVIQSGSLVEPERFRFDFSHFKPLSEEEIITIEEIVNNKIWEAISVETEVKELGDAMKMGATAVFDEKYDEMVRVVKVSNFSMELCGGTHVDNTGKIGVFKILREGSPGAGMRRIEALTLKGVMDRYNFQDGMLSRISKALNVPEGDVYRRIEELVERTNRMSKEIEGLKARSLASNIDQLIEDAVQVNGTKIISHKFDEVNVKDLRELSDLIRSRERDSVVLLGSSVGGKALLLFAATKSAVNSGIDCGNIIKEVSKLTGGGGGGRKDMAQAGGKTPESLGRALEEAVNLARRMIEG
jgi:alanyl-tRNA synthetase